MASEVEVWKDIPGFEGYYQASNMGRVKSLALERAKQQNTRSVFDIVNYGVWKYEDVISCRSAERECLKTLPTGVVSKRDMSDGYTETTTVAHLEQVIHIFEKNGGVRV